MNHIILNKYRIDELIGEGAFSKVFKGENIKTNEMVAIKIDSEQKRNLLKHEARICQKLKGIVGIPKLKYIGDQDGYQIMVTELLGKTLKEVELSNKQVINLLIKALEIVEEIHKRGIVHRDLKPDNILLTKRNNEYSITIIDYGLAKNYIMNDGEHRELKTDKSIVGTTKYCSINAHDGFELSRRDDLESLAYTFMDCLVDNLPWKKLCKEESDEDKEIKELKECVGNWILENTYSEFAVIISYVRKLNYIERPNYFYLKNIFVNLLRIII